MILYLRAYFPCEQRMPWRVCAFVLARKCDTHQLKSHMLTHTVNSEIFARILSSRIALRDIFAMLKIRD